MWLLVALSAFTLPTALACLQQTGAMQCASFETKWLADAAGNEAQCIQSHGSIVVLKHKPSLKEGYCMQQAYLQLGICLNMLQTSLPHACYLAFASVMLWQ